MTSELEQRLHDYDGVAVSILSEARTLCRDDPDFLRELIRLCFNATCNISAGATWILKAEADDGVQFGSALIDPLVYSLDEVRDWQAKLHILQAVDAFTLDKEQARIVFNWAASLSQHPRPFVRAWSLHAMVTIGMTFNDHSSDALHALAAAEEDKAASVRARARALKKTSTKATR